MRVEDTVPRFGAALIVYGVLVVAIAFACAPVALGLAIIVAAR